MAKVKTDNYVRVVGYYAKTSSMNKGKVQEYNDRKLLKDGGGVDEHSRG